MGACAIDIEKGHRQYSIKYALNDREGVASLLRDMHRLRERRFHAGDYTASDILIDLREAIARAGLTKRQAEALYWVYERDLTQKDAGEKMGITQEAVAQLIGGSIERIASIFNKWDYGELTIEYTKGTSAEEESGDEI